MLIRLSDTAPTVSPSCWVAPGAVLAGDVVVGDEASIWYGAVIRADSGTIAIGARTNIQDGTVMHTDPGLRLEVAAGVTVGHRVVLHGCRIAEDVLIGMGAIVMNRAVIGAGSIVAAGALVPEGVVIPPRSLVVGAPGKVRRETTDDELALTRLNVDHYVELAKVHAAVT